MYAGSSYTPWSVEGLFARDDTALVSDRLVGLSLLLVLFGVGQANLCIQAWRWLQTPSVQEA